MDGSTNGGKQTTGNTQFITETDFTQAKKLLQQSTDDFRRDTDKTFGFLASQLKRKFDLLETRLAEVDKRSETNSSNDRVSLDIYLALEQESSDIKQKLANVEQQ